MDKNLIQRAKSARNADELLALAKENGIAMSSDEANEKFKELHPASGEVTDDELNNVSGGGCYSDDGYLQTTIGYGCEHYERDPEGLGIDGTCCRCKYWDMRSASQLIVVGQTAPCTHPANRKV